MSRPSRGTKHSRPAENGSIGKEIDPPLLSDTMLHGARIQVLALLTAVLFGGPVAACICLEDMSMAAMPCCPDQPVDSDHGDASMPPELAAACVPLTGEGLLVEAVELPAPATIAPAAIPDRRGLDPPRLSARPAPRTFESGLPLYLTTRRLRI